MPTPPARLPSPLAWAHRAPLGLTLSLSLLLMLGCQQEVVRSKAFPGADPGRVQMPSDEDKREYYPQGFSIGEPTRQRQK